MTQTQGRASHHGGAPLLLWQDEWGAADGARGAASVAITWRHGGVSEPPYASLNLGDHVGDATAEVMTNRELLAAGVGLPPSRLVFMQQVHGADVAVVDEELLARLDAPVAAVDGLVTDLPGVALVVLVADCVPVLLADPDAGVVGVAHAGRRGVTGGVLDAVVSAMHKRGARQLKALVGPAICGRCYEVPPDMQAEVAAAVPEAAVPDVAVPTHTGTTGADLPAAVRAQLQALGVTDVAACGEGAAGSDLETTCTAENPDLFSYRRDGVTGRFGGVVWLS